MPDPDTLTGRVEVDVLGTFAFSAVNAAYILQVMSKAGSRPKLGQSCSWSWSCLIGLRLGLGLVKYGWSWS